MNLKYKYFIGTQVMFYEIEIVNEFIHSVYRACEDIENPENITVDMCFNISEFFEKVDEAQISKYDLIDGALHIDSSLDNNKSHAQTDKMFAN